MEFKDLIRERYSCRSLKGNSIPDEKLDEIIESALLAPTGCNYQPFKLWVIRGGEAADNIRNITRFDFGANTFIVVGTDKNASWTRKYDDWNIADVDGSIVATHILLAIHDVGLRSTWVGKFKAPELKEIYPQMKDYNLIGIFPIGESDESEASMPADLHYKSKTKEELVEYL